MYNLTVKVYLNKIQDNDRQIKIWQSVLTRLKIGFLKYVGIINIYTVKHGFLNNTNINFHINLFVPFGLELIKLLSTLNYYLSLSLSLSLDLTCNPKNFINKNVINGYFKMSVILDIWNVGMLWFLFTSHIRNRHGPRPNWIIPAMWRNWRESNILKFT